MDASLENVEAPTGIEPAASWFEARCSVQMSYGAVRRIRGWPGPGRTGRLPPCHEGALPLSYRPMRLPAPGFEPGPFEVTARRATVYTTRQWRRERDSDPCAGAGAPTYLGSNQAPSARF